ncbi:MAG: lipoate--protein ligase family protein [Nitrospirae bacterium]|nr:lipoate--protein ligase family protein [Nitrospirota bacterium]
MVWRLIDSGTCDAYMNMAIDEAIAISVRQELAPPTLRFYQWQGPSVTLGCYQRSEEVDLLYCEKSNIPVVRRPTGGRAILHGEDLTYSFSSKNTPPYFSEGLLKTYNHISAAFLEALKNLGFHAVMKTRKEKGRVLTGSSICFQSVSFGEITIENKKIIGSAQKRWPDGFLQQGSILLRLNTDEMLRVFRDSRAEEIASSMTGLYHYQPSLDTERLKENIQNAFEETFGVELKVSSLTEEEYSLAIKLCNEKYTQQEWTLSR